MVKAQEGCQKVQIRLEQYIGIQWTFLLTIRITHRNSSRFSRFTWNEGGTCWWDYSGVAMRAQIEKIVCMPTQSIPGKAKISRHSQLPIFPCVLSSIKFDERYRERQITRRLLVKSALLVVLFSSTSYMPSCVKGQIW